jgi:hypothetical protein
MHQQLWGYKVEEKLYVGVREQKRLNTTAQSHQTQRNVLIFIFGLFKNILMESIPMCCDNIRIYITAKHNTLLKIINKAIHQGENWSAEHCSVCIKIRTRVAATRRKNGRRQALKYRPKGKRSIGRPRKRWKDQLHLEG